jgi:hypothetical protein
MKYISEIIAITKISFCITLYTKFIALAYLKIVMNIFIKILTKSFFKCALHY